MVASNSADSMKLLLEISYLTEACFLSNNVDDRKFKMALRLAQEQLKSSLGAEFYEQVNTQHDGGTLSSDNNSLYEDYIKDFLAWQTYLEYLSFSQVDSTPTGIREHLDDTSSIASDARFYSLVKNVRLKAEDYKGKMITFLKLSQEKDTTKFAMWSGCQADTFGFGISSVSGGKCGSFSVNKAIVRNE